MWLSKQEWMAKKIVQSNYRKARARITEFKFADSKIGDCVCSWVARIRETDKFGMMFAKKTLRKENMLTKAYS